MYKEFFFKDYKQYNQAAWWPHNAVLPDAADLTP